MDVEVVQQFDAVMAACPTAVFWEPREYRGGARWSADADKALLNIAILVGKEPGSPAIGEVLLSVVTKLNRLPASPKQRPNPVYSTGPNPAAKAIYALKRGVVPTAAGAVLVTFVNGTNAITNSDFTLPDSNSGALVGTVCEIDSPASDLLFQHKFFCTCGALF
jgi:hypothetical protein